MRLAKYLRCLLREEGAQGGLAVTRAERVVKGDVSRALSATDVV